MTDLFEVLQISEDADEKEIKKAIEQIAEEKGLDPSQILEAIETSIAAAYKKEYGKRSEIIKC